MTHVRASFGALGYLVKVMPSRPAYGEPAVVVMEELPASLQLNREEVATFPGPLVKYVQLYTGIVVDSSFRSFLQTCSL